MESPSSNNSSSSPFSITNATNTGESKWLKAIGKSQSSSPKKRLFIFPHAGSNALYFIKWNFPSEVAAFAIQLLLSLCFIFLQNIYFFKKKVSWKIHSAFRS